MVCPCPSMRFSAWAGPGVAGVRMRRGEASDRAPATRAALLVVLEVAWVVVGAVRGGEEGVGSDW